MKNFFSNKYVKFSLITVPYILMVIWVGNYWWMLGVPILFDIYISKKVKWNFYKSKYEAVFFKVLPKVLKIIIEILV